MRAQRRLAVLAAAGTMIMAAAGVLLAPGVASANPGNDEHSRGRPGYHQPSNNGNGQGSGSGNDYPAPPASVAVSSGTVRAGKAVRVTGNGFGRHEPVVVQIRYRPPTRFWFPQRGIIIGQETVWSNKEGKFSTYAQTWLPGKVIITARGLRSGKTGSATVRVLLRGGNPFWGGAWWGAGGSGTPSGTVAVSHHTPASGRGDDTPLYVLTVALLALTASSVLTQRFTRRRRTGTG